METLKSMVLLLLGIPVYLLWVVILVVTAFLPTEMREEFDEMVRTVVDELSRKEAEKNKLTR